MRRIIAAAVAWIVGTLVYVVAAVLWGGYDGFPSLIILPICGVLVGAATVGLSLFLGLILGWSGLSWQPGQLGAVLVVLGSLMVLSAGSSLGLVADYMQPDTGEHFEAIHPVAALGGYLQLVFTITNWPRSHPSADR